MPRIPDTDSLGARPIPRFQRSVVSVRNRGSVAEAAGQFGATINQAAGQALEKEDKVNYATAKGKLLQDLTAAQSELENDPDYGTFGARFDERATKVREEAGKLIKSRSDRAAFEADAGALISSAGADVKKLAWGKEVTTLKANADTFAEEQMDLAANAPTMDARAATLTNYGTYIDGLVQKGILDPVEGGKRKRAFNGDSMYQRVQSLNSQDRLDEAWEAFDGNRKFFTSDQEISLENMLRGGMDRRQSYQDADLAIEAVAAIPATAPGQPAPGDAPAGGRTAFKQRVRSAESSGNDQAKNDKSSASGRYQFTKDTWERLGGDWGNRFDPGEQERLMDKLTTQNEAALKRGGIALTAGNYYLAHFAGAGGARALHTNPNAPVEAVLGKDAVEANPFLRGMNGRDVIDWAAKKMGSSSAGAGRTEVPDLGTAYDTIDTQAEAEQWTPERRERAKEQVSVRINRMKAVENERQSASYDVAMEKVANLGDNFTDLTQLGDLDVSGTQLNTLTNVAAANARALRAEGDAAAKARIENSYRETALSLENIAQSRPADFATMKLDRFMPGLSPAQRVAFTKKQADVAESLRGWTPYSGINAAVTRATTFGGVALDTEDKVAVRQIMQAEAERLHKAGKGRELSEKDFDDLLVSAVRDVPTTGFFGGKGKMKRYDLTPGSISTNDRNGVESALKAAGNSNPSEDDIMSFYRRNMTPARAE